MRRALESLVAVTVMLVACGVARAQTAGNPAGFAPDTAGANAGKPAPDEANTQDRLFVRQASLGGRAEVALGELAGKNASSKAVRDFAGRMVDDHRAANDELALLAKDLDDAVPDGLDPHDREVRDALGKRSGRDFDQDYLAVQIADHQRTANLLLWEIDSGQSAALTKYAAKTLPVVLEHLAVARDLADDAPPPAPPAAPAQRGER